MKLIYKNQKIKALGVLVILVAIVSLGLFVQSCSNEMDDHLSNMEIRQNANAIAIEYVELVDNQYVLNLSEEDAISLGISKSDYDRIQTEMYETNAYIIEAQKQGIQIVITDPQQSKIEAAIPRLKADDEMFGGKFNMIDTNITATYHTFVPTQYNQVTFAVTTPCSFTFTTVQVFWGGKMPTASTVIVGPGGSATLNLPVSNSVVTFKAFTECSGGGTVSLSFWTKPKTP